MMRSKAERSTTRSFTMGKALARKGSTVMASPSGKRRMWIWQVVAAPSGSCARPLITRLHIPQMPSRQSWSKATGSAPFLMRTSLRMSSISSRDASGEMSLSS